MVAVQPGQRRRHDGLTNLSRTQPVTNTAQTLPGDLAYLPPKFRNLTELSQKQLGEAIGVTRETVRQRHIAGTLPPKLPNRPKSRPKWSAAAINEHLRQQCADSLAANSQAKND